MKFKKTFERTEDDWKAIEEAEAKRPKIQMVKDYGLFKTGDVLQLSKGRREFLVSQGFAKNVSANK